MSGPLRWACTVELGASVHWLPRGASEGPPVVTDADREQDERRTLEDSSDDE